MWPSFLFAALTLAILGWVFTTFRQTRKVHALERSKEEIQVEETLVFDFLHGLGEAFRETIKPAELHRLIVEGATRVLDAHGGALYVVDRTGTKLLPAYVSQGCSPLVEVPPHILEQTATSAGAIDSYLRLHTIAVGEGLLGRIWQSGQPVLLTELSQAPELEKLQQTTLGTSSVMVSPLLYGRQNMGVLVVANRAKGLPFSQSD